jgi:hypothetical protein
MLAIDNTLISDTIFSHYFKCDIACCKGFCCVEGDAGAPLEEDEISVLEDAIQDIMPYMNMESRRIIMQNGVFDYDIDGILVTPLVNDRECAFVYFENNIAKCAIEKACLEEKTSFLKPISCHLYPIRITKNNQYDVLNYHQWDVCKKAREKGNELKISVFDFLHDALLRKYGKEWIEKVKKIHPC